MDSITSQLQETRCSESIKNFIELTEEMVLGDLTPYMGVMEKRDPLY